MRLYGDANDYVGKGLSGGRIVVRPSREAPFAAEDNVIAGNVIGYGATGGEIFLRGRVGERFCVRNSGALAVVEGVGDHALEYMTGGRAVILGATGRNIAAGMSGGIGYVLDLARHRVNPEMVDIDPLDGESAQWLRDVLVRYAEDTESTVAHALLADWGRWSEQFSVIMPRDYRRALDARSGGRRPTGYGRATDCCAWRLLVADTTGFLKFDRELPPRRPVEVRIRDWKDVYTARQNGEDPLSRPPRCASRPPGAWTAASRSATTPARWPT